jgi:hypothetical protein
MSESGIGVELLISILEDLGAPFLVGGSLASSIHGLPRSSQDLDFVADLSNVDIAVFVGRLGGEFYADLEHIRDSLGRGRPFNIIHRASAFKYDIFPARSSYHAEQLSRRCLRETRAFGPLLKLPIATPEDSILSKLLWYRAGGEISDRQWHDIRGVLDVKKGSLDVAYLQAWAARLGVADLLSRAMKEASGE